jgi:hypothetical protein
MEIPAEHFLHREERIDSKYAGLKFGGEYKEEVDPGLLKVKYVKRPRSAEK